ncbi:unnamed protein product [Effrenium voratum]|nr:unnamed protein product [Effrenium voratum]
MARNERNEAAGAAIAELIPEGKGRRLHAAPRQERGNANGLRRWPLPCHAEPRLVVVPSVRKASSLPSLTVGWPMRSRRSGGSRLRLLSNATPKAKCKEPCVSKPPRPERMESRELEDSALEARFHVELKRVSSEVSEVQRRQLSTRNHLSNVKTELNSNHELEASLQAAADEVKAEVKEHLGTFMAEWESFQPVSKELQALADEAEMLTDTDLRMKELLERMSRKLDAFDQTLGNHY